MTGMKFARNFALILLALVLSATAVHGQTAQPQLYVVCYSQQSQPTVYWSGVLQGPVTALPAFRTGFAQFLTQSFSYQGNVVCTPTNSAVNAQSMMQTGVNALRALKKNIVQTGWIQAATDGQTPKSGQAANNGQAATGPQTQSPTRPGGGNTGSGGDSSGASTAAQIIDSVLNSGSNPNAGSGGGAGAGGGGTPAAGGASGAKASQGQAANRAGGNGGGNGGNGANANPTSLVASTLSSLVAKGNSSNGSGGGAGNATTQGAPGQVRAPGANGGGRGTAGQASPAAASATNSRGGLAVPEGALGVAQFSTTKLTIYGCGRQAMQVVCVADLTNQNMQDTLVKSADVWKDTFIVDDRGDRHPRTSGFFLNIDGEQRQELDISYGKSARLVLTFDGVQTKVEKVTLRSATGGLDVEDIVLIVPSGAPSPQQQ
jgi:hypothetical protein